MTTMAAGDALRVALRHVKNGDHAGALPILDRALKSFPCDAQLLQLKGLALRNLGELDQALPVLRTAAAIAPDHPLVAHTLARATMEAGLPAVALFEQALKLRATDPEILLGLAAAWLAQGRPDMAETTLARESLKRPQWLFGHRQLMKLRLMMGSDLNHAIEGFARAVEAQPDNAQIWHGWIAGLIEIGQPGEADAVLARASTTVPDTPLWTMLDPLIAAALHQNTRADRTFAALGTIDRPDLLIHFVRHQFRMNRYELATREAERGTLMAGGRDFWPYVALGWRLTQDSRWHWLEGNERLVSIIDLDEAQSGSLIELARRLRSLHLTVSEPPEQTLRGGTQTDGPLFHRIDPEIRQLKAAIEVAVRQHIDQLPPLDPKHPTLAMRRADPIHFAGAWSVRLRSEGYHVDHVHPAGWISSAFYVVVPDQLSQDHGGWLSLGEVRDLVPTLPPIRLIEPRPGRLVLFPSIMWHGTRAFPAGERITIAFDVAASRFSARQFT